MTNTIPNLDTLDEESLMNFFKKYHRSSRKDAEALIGDKRWGYTVIANELANYACCKSVAMKCRREGKIDSALVYERECEMSYKRIPEDLRW